MNFASDNITGASAPVLEALVAGNNGPATAYGSDAWTKRVEETLAGIFERPVGVALVVTGTAANALALACITPPWGSVICHEESHIADDECGAPEFFTHGAKLMGLPGVAGRLDIETVRALLDRIPASEKAMQPAALSITQATEAGTIHDLETIRALSALAHERGLAVHMDGARFANALVALDVSPAAMTWKVGIDVLSFGATKNGCLAAEAVIFFDPDKLAEFKLRRKRGGHTLSKGRLIGAQLEAYLAQDHWLANARHANAMAQRLAATLRRIPGVRLPWPVEANEVFPILPKGLDRRLRDAGFVYHPWVSISLPVGEAVGLDEVMGRFVTSFATVDGEIAALEAALGQALAA